MGQLRSWADERTAPVQSALSSTTISGYVQEDVTWQFPPTPAFESGPSSFSASPVSVVPEPTTTGLVLLGAFILAVAGKRGWRAKG